MAQFLALALAGIAILRQLRAQRSANVHDQMMAWNREFEAPPMVRDRLALMLAIEHRDPGAGFPQANDEVSDFFERIGHLVSRGHGRDGGVRSRHEGLADRRSHRDSPGEAAAISGGGGGLNAAATRRGWMHRPTDRDGPRNAIGGAGDGSPPTAR